MADGPSAYVEFDAQGTELHVYRASALGHCDQALMYALAGIPGAAPPAQMQIVFQQGHDAEQPIIDMLLADQKAMRCEGRQEQVEFRFANAIVRGHIDGRLVHGNVQYLLEVKKLRPDLWKEWCAAEKAESRWPSGELWDKYAFQTSVYSHALGGLPICVVCGHDSERDGQVTEIKYRWYGAPFVDKSKIIARLMHLETLAKQGVPKDDCTLGHYPCAYYQFHAEKGEGADTEVLDLSGDLTLRELLKERDDKRAFHRIAQDALELVEKRFKEYMAEIGRDAHGALTRCGNLVIKWHKETIPAGTVERKEFTKNYPTITKARSKGRD